jgi:hypothetical protein
VDQGTEQGAGQGFCGRESPTEMHRSSTLSIIARTFVDLMCIHAEAHDTVLTCLILMTGSLLCVYTRDARPFQYLLNELPAPLLTFNSMHAFGGMTIGSKEFAVGETSPGMVR